MSSAQTGTFSLTHLQRLEAESIQIMREVVAEADNPVMLYSIGKDSAVMLRLAAAAVARGRLFNPLEPAEAPMDAPLRQALVTSWGQWRGEAMALVTGA